MLSCQRQYPTMTYTLPYASHLLDPWSKLCLLVLLPPLLRPPAATELCGVSCRTSSFCPEDVMGLSDGADPPSPPPIDFAGDPACAATPRAAAAATGGAAAAAVASADESAAGPEDRSSTRWYPTLSVTGPIAWG